ncbi:MAG TPA: ribonuclease III [Sphingomonadales bacterium]|nr:ribonuclease III [Sphingomonadales bacterium]
MAARGKGNASPAKALAKALGRSIKSERLLLEALTHPSLEGAANYQRLEFLGDRVLGLAVGKLLFDAFPEGTEGDLSRRQASLVRRDALAAIALRLKIAPHIRMTETAGRGGGRENPSILADVLEALIAVLYLEDGLGAVEAFVTKNWGALLKRPSLPKDPKSALQEWAQGRGYALPEYALAAQKGPDHAPRFTVRVSVKGLGEGKGEGASKQEAETAAARTLFAALKKREGVKP